MDKMYEIEDNYESSTRVYLGCRIRVEGCKILQPKKAIGRRGDVSAAKSILAAEFLRLEAWYSQTENAPVLRSLVRSRDESSGGEVLLLFTRFFGRFAFYRGHFEIIYPVPFVPTKGTQKLSAVMASGHDLYARVHSANAHSVSAQSDFSRAVLQTVLFLHPSRPEGLKP